MKTIIKIIKKERLIVSLSLVIFFSLGYTLGCYLDSNFEVKEKPKTAYQILQEGYDRINK